MLGAEKRAMTGLAGWGWIMIQEKIPSGRHSYFIRNVLQESFRRKPTVPAVPALSRKFYERRVQAGFNGVDH
jgi:hypothetical protein